MQNIKTKIQNTLNKPIFWILITVPMFASALAGEIGGTGCTAGKICNPLGLLSFTALIEKVAGIVAKLGIPVAAVFIMYAGLLFVTARGSEEQLKKAKAILGWSLAGTAILLGAWVIAKAIQGTIMGLGTP